VNQQGTDNIQANSPAMEGVVCVGRAALDANYVGSRGGMKERAVGREQTPLGITVPSYST
jgi:hypothetical protein